MFLQAFQSGFSVSCLIDFVFVREGTLQELPERQIVLNDKYLLPAFGNRAAFIFKMFIINDVNAGSCAWYLAPIEKEMSTQRKYRKQCAAFRDALAGYKAHLDVQSSETPYGVPYRPSIWGAGWDIQSFGYRHYFLAKNYPDIFAPDQVFNALNFILGCHPGLNRQSFASGVGAQSATVGYGLNRADWSYIPGGVVSGTALIRPDFPELLVFPYLWQQVEYVLGGGSSHYMFLVLAATDLLND